MNKLHIGIAGAGLMGSLLAWQLVRKGHIVDLYEKNQLCHHKQAASIAAGMLAPYSELPIANNDVFNLGCRSLLLWPTILKELAIEEIYNSKGSLLISLNSQNALIDHFIKKILAKNPKSNIISVLKYEVEPELSFPGYYFAEEASLDTNIFMRTLSEKLMQLGCHIFENTVVDHIANGEITTINKTQRYHWVIDCRGTGAQSNFANLRSVRGELIHVMAPEVPFQCTIRVFDGKKEIYIVPRANNEFIIGASEIEINDESPISVRTCVELFATANAVHTGFSEARILAMKTACRPALSDNLPQIKFLNKTILVNGLYRHGYLLAPALVEEILKEVTNAVSY